MSAPSHQIAQLQRVSVASEPERVAVSDQATHTIRKLAERQHGVISRRQLMALGLGKELVKDRVRCGHLLVIHRGVFALGHGTISQEGRWLAAVLACGPGALLSHGSAAELWGMRTARGPIEVLRVSGHRRPHGVRLHQTRSLPPSDATFAAGIPVTSAERTLLDLAGRLDERQLQRALVAVERNGHLRWSELSRLLSRAQGRRGAGRLRRVAEAVDPRAIDAMSPLEIDFLALCQKFGLPAPQVNVLVENFLVDFYWPAARVVVETDGYAYHADRPAFERDHERTVALAAAGYEVHRATHQMLVNSPAKFLNLVRRSLQRHCNA